MQAGQLVASDVAAFASRVLVNGVQRPVVSWKVDRSLVGDLPEQVAATSGVSQATGTVVWAHSDDVTEVGLNPWRPSSGWLPMAGDRVQIFAGDGNTEWSQFVGVIDSSEGDIGGGFSSKIIDRIDDFSVPVNLPALVDVLPPLEADGPFRRFRLTPRFHVHTALRRAGFSMVPLPEYECTVDVPAIGSMWPLVGTLASAQQKTDESLSPDWSPERYVRDARVTVIPAKTRHWEIPAQLTMCIGAKHAGTARVVAHYGASTFEVIAYPATVSLRVNGEPVVSYPHEGEAIVQALYDNGTVRLRTSKGGDASGTASMNTGDLLSLVTIDVAPESQVRGFQLSHPSRAGSQFASLNFKPTANVVTGTLHDTIASSRATGKQTSLQLLSEIGECLLWPFWIDENGVAQAVQSDVLRNRPPVQTVTTLDDIRELSWSTDLLGARSKITATYEASAITRRRDYSQEVWASNESTVLQSRDEQETFIEAPTDEAWIMVDETLGYMSNSNVIAAMNKGIGTVGGGVYTDGEAEEQATSSAANKLSVTMERITEGTWKIVHKTGDLAAGKQVELRTWSNDYVGRTELWPMWRDKGLPRVRAKGKVEWAERSRTSELRGSHGPELILDCKTWATGHLVENETNVVDRLLAFVAPQVVKPQPVISSLRVGFDPRRQLGDVIIVESPSLMGVRLKCLITGKSDSAGTNFTQDLSVRIIESENTYATYADFADAWGPTADYGTLATAWGALATYSDFAEDPLKGTE